MSTYPPSDDRLRHLIAQEINVSVDRWKLAWWIAGGIVKDSAIRAELHRISDAHAAGEPCGDRHCTHCWSAMTAETGGAQ
ncbi:hypothetical protein [Streptomyces reniochalinae]|uniref:Uncharacterized protein n=1 Tax=Streptomyces reniochalinae TaxID=2250578 RepID=A0A367EUL7_9ACTN|nr:hypothetical protein [Streptomyces reniochalinae]RCG21804.1 hypothetical protein DQ392_08840 [Streptomyces reniochalinae]